MCFTVLPARPVQQLVAAAQAIQSLMDAGTIGDAFNEGKPDQINAAIAAFDRLNECTGAMLCEQKPVSPFLRYRQEIMGQYETAKKLRDLVMNLFNGKQGLRLSLLFGFADDHHTRIALECIVSYTQNGENDRHFMALAAEIVGSEAAEVSE